MRFIMSKNRDPLQTVRSLFLLLACVSAAGCQTDEQRYEAQARACIEMQAKDPSVRVECLENVRRAFPDKGMVHLLLASAYRESGRLDDAEKAVDIFVNSYKNDASGYGVKCEILRDQKEFQDALAACGKAVSLKPDDLAYRRTTASVYEASNDVDRAESLYKQILSENPKDRSALLALGRLYEKTGRLDQAIETYEELLKLDPEFKDKLKEGIKRLNDQKAAQPARDRTKKLTLPNPNLR